VWTRGLLIRRSLTDHDLAFFSTWCPAGTPWENGYVESFKARLRDELLDGEIFSSLREADHHRKLETSLV
jgi:SRSO17 transposase